MRGKVSADFCKRHFSFRNGYVRKTENNAAGQSALGGIVAVVEFGFNDWAAELADALVVLGGFVFTGIHKNGEGFETFLYSL